MIHQPSFGAQGMVSDVEITYKQGEKAKNKLNQFIREKSNQTLERVTKDTDRDTWLDAQEALDYGIVDSILRPKK